MKFQDFTETIVVNVAKRTEAWVKRTCQAEAPERLSVMIFARSLILSAALLAAFAGSASSATVSASFPAPTSIPVVAETYNANGNEIAFHLDFAPQTGVNLTAVKVTGLDFIEGRFSNLAQGQEITLEYSGQPYRFVANYYGGSGNDLVLHWAEQELVVWGENQGKQLGHERTHSEPTPILFDPHFSALAGRQVIAIASGITHSLALCSDGTLAEWADKNYEQSFNGKDRLTEIPRVVDRSGVLAGKEVVSIAMGDEHALVLCSDGTLVTWTTALSQFREMEIVDQSGVLSGKRVVKIAAAGNHSLVLCSDGTLASWGRGPLGNGDSSYNEAYSPVPVRVEQGGVLADKTVVGIAAGISVSMAICSDGSLATWGKNDYGQLGNGSGAFGQVSWVPVLVRQDGVLAGKQVVAAAAGKFHSVALCSDGTIAAWGYNAHGSLGNGGSATSYVPVMVDSTGFLAGRTVVAVSAGMYSSTAIASDGTLALWGDGISRPESAKLENLHEAFSVVSVAESESNNLALSGNGKLAHFAYSGPPEIKQAISPVLTGKTVVSIAAGDRHNLALAADGTLASWGSGNALGIGPKIQQGFQVHPIRGNGILAGRTVIAVSAGFDHSLALCDDGTIAAWGNNEHGQLGNGSNEWASLPVAVDRLGALAGKSVVAIRAGDHFSLALCSDGSVFSWGRNSEGQLGDGSNISKSRPVPVDQSGALSGKSVTQISAGVAHCVALCADGGLIAWGQGVHGELGNRQSADSSSPVFVDLSGSLSEKSVIAVEAAQRFSLALTSDGTLFSWGYNELGNLGDSTNVIRDAPVPVIGNGVLQNKLAVEISTGADHSIVLCADGTLATWGSNQYSQIGRANVNAFNHFNTPTLVDRTGILSGKRVTSVFCGAYHNIAIVAISPHPLKNLITSVGPLPFQQTVFSYSLTVDHEIEAITLTPTYTEGLSTVTVNDVAVDTGMPSQAIPLNVGTTSIVVRMPGLTGPFNSYTIHVLRRTPRTDATLTGLVVESGVLSPAFSPDLLEYDTSVPYATSAVRITPFPSNDQALFYMHNEQGYLNGNLPIPLSVGTNEIHLTVVAQGNSNTRSYLVRIVRRTPAPDLSGLKASVGALSPAFAASNLFYQIRVPHEVPSISVTPACQDATAVLKVNGGVVTAGTAGHPIPLKFGSNPITISVGDRGGFSLKTYTLTVMREDPPAAFLTGLSAGSVRLSPAFKPEIKNYSAKVSNRIRSVKIKALAKSGVASIKVNGSTVKSGVLRVIPLAVGRNTIQVRLVGRDGSTNAYKMVITRLPARSKSSSSVRSLVDNPKPDPAEFTTLSSDGDTYLRITSEKRENGSIPRVEVSSDLVEWFSGELHTKTLVDDRNLIDVQDRTPLMAGKKRFIRLRWLFP
jgi:alpha-tubulin suppressor-like RCC1 family protein